MPIYLYGHSLTVFTDHSAVKAILEAPSLNGKHACWWTEVYGSGIRNIQVYHRAGSVNANADALSHNPHLHAPAEGIAVAEVQVTLISTSESVQLGDMDVEGLLDFPPHEEIPVPADFRTEQKKDPHLKDLIFYILQGDLSEHQNQAPKIAAKFPFYAVVEGALYFVDPFNSLPFVEREGVEHILLFTLFSLKGHSRSSD